MARALSRCDSSENRGWCGAHIARRALIKTNELVHEEVETRPAVENLPETHALIELEGILQKGRSGAVEGMLSMSWPVLILGRDASAAFPLSWVRLKFFRTTSDEPDGLPNNTNQ